MVTKSEVQEEVEKEIPTFSIALVDKKGAAIDKHVAMRKVLATEFILPILSGNLLTVDVEEIARWKEALTKVTKAFDDALLAMPEDKRNGLEPFRKPRTDKGSKAVDPEDLLG